MIITKLVENFKYLIDLIDVRYTHIHFPSIKPADFFTGWYIAVKQ